MTTITKLFTKAEVLGCITGRALYMDDPCCKEIRSHILKGYPVSELTIQLQKHCGDDTSKWCDWYDANSDWLLNEYVEVGQLYA